jgi:cysteinyl-tRNA synthetase
MAMKYLGNTLDIHAGGVDLVFPHHENEIAQSEAITNKPFSRFWLHSEHLMVEGQKMAKSLGNFYTLRDLMERGYKPETIRYLLASVPYRKKLNFTLDGLKAADSAIERLRSFKLRLDTERFPEGVNEQLLARRDAALEQFETSLDDDLNTAEALAAMFAYIRDINSAMDSGEYRAGNVEAGLSLLRRFDSVFEVLTPSETSTALSDAEIEAKIAQRTAAKKARNFARADEIRRELADAGIIIEDTKEGVRWKRR